MSVPPAERTARLGLAKPPDDSDEWGVDYREAMDVLDAHPGVAVVGSVAEVTEPFVGQQVYEESTNRYMGYSASGWREVVSLGTAPLPTAFSYYQAVPASVWEVHHPLPFEPGGVSVVDTAGTEVEGEVHYLVPGHIRLIFSAPFMGTARLS